MSAWIEVTEGATAGSRRPLAGDDPLLVGRHPGAHLRMHPEADASVSGRHALLVPSSSGWTIRDLGSRNGTWVNGTRVEGERRLTDGDRIRLGPDGPVLVFREGTPGVGDPAGPAGSGRAGRRRWTRTATVSGIAVVAVAALMYLAGSHATRRAWERDRDALEARMDSVLEVARTRARVAESLEGRVEGLVSALHRSEAEVQDLQAALATAEEEGDESREVEALRQRLQAVSAALERQQLVASLDFEGIEASTRPGTAQLYVETGEGEVVTATAFGVSPDGIVMTNRHAVRGPDGRSVPRRIAVQFADSRQVWPASVAAVSSSSDLALLRIERLEGPIPTVVGFNDRPDTLASGAPVAMLGFSLGGEPPGEGGGVVRPLLTAGVISGRWGDYLEIQGYGEEGASGSPVLDAQGRVAGVLVGGRDEGGERRLLAIPAPEALGLLRRLRTSSPGGAASR